MDGLNSFLLNASFALVCLLCKDSFIALLICFSGLRGSAPFVAWLTARFAPVTPVSLSASQFLLSLKLFEFFLQFLHPEVESPGFFGGSYSLGVEADDFSVLLFSFVQFLCSALTEAYFLASANAADVSSCQRWFRYSVSLSLRVASFM